MAAVDVVADGAGRYVSWGAIQISLTNLVIIGAMVVVFLLAILLPFPRPHDETEEQTP
jgi:hypothetical protein